MNQLHLFAAPYVTMLYASDVGTACRHGYPYLIHNKELCGFRDSGIDTVFLEGLQQIVCVPPQGLHACLPEAAFVVALPKSEHTPG